MSFRNVSGAFAGGVAGALVAASALWLFGKLGLASTLGINFAPKLGLAWMYPRVVWGGGLGLLFLLPLLREQNLLRGILFSLVPTMMVFLKFVPGFEKSLFGMSFGPMRPELVLIINFAWGITAAFWYRESVR